MQNPSGGNENQEATQTHEEKLHDQTIAEEEKVREILSTLPDDIQLESISEEEQKDIHKKEMDRDVVKKKEVKEEDDEDEDEDEQYYDDEEEEEEKESVLDKIYSETQAETKPKEKWKEKKEYYKKLAAEKKRAEAQAIALAKENANLKEQEEERQIQDFIAHGQELQQKEKRLEAKARRAMETSDAETFYKTNKELNKIARELEVINEQSQQIEQYLEQKPQKQTQQAQAQQQQTTPGSSKINAWIAEHPEVNPSSRRYNVKLATNMRDFATSLDKQLIEAGQQSDLQSKKYFDLLNTRFDNMINKKSKSTKRPRVSSVNARPSNTYKKSDEDKVVLNSVDIAWAKEIGYGLDEARKHKLKTLRKQNKL